MHTKRIRTTVYRERNRCEIEKNKYRQTGTALHDIAMLIYHVFRSMVNLILFSLLLFLKKILRIY